MKPYQRITAQERDQIAYWVAIGVSIREIARRLHRSHSSIADEIQRNQVNGLYGSIQAHRAAEQRKRTCHQKYLLRTRPALQAYVLEKLYLGWSPEQIAGRLKQEGDPGRKPTRRGVHQSRIHLPVHLR